MNAIFGAGEGERVRDGDIGSDERGGRGRSLTVGVPSSWKLGKM